MSLKCYRNIDELPVWNFLRILKTEDVRYLMVLEDYYQLPSIEDMSELNEIWDEVSGQIIDINGINEDTQELFRLQKEIILGYINIHSTGDIGELTSLKIMQKRLERLSATSNKKVDFETLIVDMEVEFKMQFDLTKMTVSKFYKYINKYANGRKSHNE
jgi:hypothetical protein